MSRCFFPSRSFQLVLHQYRKYDQMTVPEVFTDFYSSIDHSNVMRRGKLLQSSSLKRLAQCGACSDGFKTQQFPAAIAPISGCKDKKNWIIPWGYDQYLSEWFFNLITLGWKLGKRCFYLLCFHPFF